jgi:hypothetical protein
MNRIIWSIILLLFSACTSSRWIIDETPQADLSEPVVISTHPVIELGQMPTPDMPFLRISGIDKQTVEYPLKIEASRVIQSYRPRYGWLAFGLMGAGALVYIANADNLFETDLSKTQKNVLYGSAAFIVTASLLNMKPYGDPRYTGEKRFLSEVDREQRTTERGASTNPFDVLISASHNGEELVTGLQKTVRGTLNLNLISELGLRAFSPDVAKTIDITLKSEFDEKSISIPVEQILRRYVRVVSRNTPLRSSPQTGINNVITNVAEASLLPWVETVDNGWYRVMLGVTPTYIRETDGALVWRPAIDNESELVVSTSNSAFGGIDVERNIPSISGSNSDAIAIVIANTNYQDLTIRNEHGMRSLQLMKAYLKETLGYKDDRIIIVDDFNSEESVSTLVNFNSDEQTIHGKPITRNTDVFVYYTGAGGIIESNGRTEAAFLPIDGLPNEGITVRELFTRLRGLPVNRIQVLIDADFSARNASAVGSQTNPSYAQLASIVTNSNNKSWVLFASEPSQLAGTYVSSDRRTDRIHGILTYYFCRALQDGNTENDMIMRYLQRNMTFTSRRLHNRPQDPTFFGNREGDLLRIIE